MMTFTPPSGRTKDVFPLLRAGGSRGSILGCCRETTSGHAGVETERCSAVQEFDLKNWRYWSTNQAECSDLNLGLDIARLVKESKLEEAKSNSPSIKRR